MKLLFNNFDNHLKLYKPLLISKSMVRWPWKKEKKEEKKEEKIEQEVQEEGMEQQVEEFQQPQETQQVPQITEKRETIEEMTRNVYSSVLEIHREIDNVKKYIDNIGSKINGFDMVCQEIAKKIENYKKDVEELEKSLFPKIQSEIDTCRQRIEELEKNFKKQVENYESQLASIGEIVSRYKEISNKKGEYIKQITELKERLEKMEKEINRYEEIRKALERKGDKIVGIIGKYLKTSDNYDENAQKMIEALVYDEEDLIAAYKLGRELGYSREQLKNIAAAIALKNYRAWKLTNESKLINIGEDPERITRYIAEIALKASEDKRERIEKEIFK